MTKRHHTPEVNNTASPSNPFEILQNTNEESNKENGNANIVKENNNASQENDKTL